MYHNAYRWAEASDSIIWWHSHLLKIRNHPIFHIQTKQTRPSLASDLLWFLTTRAEYVTLFSFTPSCIYIYVSQIFIILIECTIIWFYIYDWIIPSSLIVWLKSFSLEMILSKSDIKLDMPTLVSITFCFSYIGPKIEWLGTFKLMRLVIFVFVVLWDTVSLTAFS